MEFTEIQKALIGSLQMLNLEKEGIIGVFLMLKTEEQQLEMLQWIHPFLRKDPDQHPTQNEIMEKALEIYQKDG